MRNYLNSNKEMIYVLEAESLRLYATIDYHVNINLITFHFSPERHDFLSFPKKNKENFHIEITKLFNKIMMLLGFNVEVNGLQFSKRYNEGNKLEIFFMISLSANDVYGYFSMIFSFIQCL